MPGFPDPASYGDIPKGDPQEFGVSSTLYQSAQSACAHLVSASRGSIRLCYAAGACPAPVVERALTLMRRFSECIRAHGVPNWPDPTVGSSGRPFFDASGAGISSQFENSSSFESKVRLCGRQVGGSAGVPVPLG